jgi:serine/threonine protein kinase
VVQIFDLGVDVHGNYLAMEYVFGESLARLLAKLANKGKRLPLAAGLFVAENLCLALHHAHTFAAGKSPQPVIHRDVSPHNVLVGFEGAVKLTDFGVAKVKGSQGNTTLGIIKGKVGYMAPEQIEGEPVDARSDLFALGIVLYELCTGEAPFKGNNVRAVFDAVTKAHPPPPSSLAPCGPDLNALILRALEKDREKRHQSASDFLDALEDARQELGLKTNPLAFGRTVSEAFGPLPEGRDEGQSVVSSILTYLDARTDNPTAPPTRSSGNRDLEKTLLRDRSGRKRDG